MKIYFACWFLKLKYIMRTPKKVFHEYFHYACSLKAHGKATKSGKKETNFFDIFNEITIFKVMLRLKIYFACWFLKLKYIIRTQKKIFHEYFHYACSLKAHGKATKSGKKENFFFTTLTNSLSSRWCNAWKYILLVGFSS